MIIFILKLSSTLNLMKKTKHTHWRYNMNFDIKSDFKDIVKNILSAIYATSKDELSDDYNTLVIRFSKFIRQRALLERKWTVKISSNINIPNNLKDGFESLVNALKEGVGILRYTTTQIDYIEHDDMMLDCDGFYHFHLSNLVHPKNPNFNRRTDERAFVYCDAKNSTAYIVDIYKHGAENNDIKDRIKKLWKEFPEACKYSVHEGKLLVNFDDKDVMELRKNQINAGIQLDENHYYMPPFGITTAATSTLDTFFLMQINKALDNIEQLVRKEILPNMKDENITDIKIYNTNFAICLKFLSDSKTKLDMVLFNDMCELLQPASTLQIRSIAHQE